MTRIVFTLIGGKSWTGGYNYLLNLVRVLAAHRPGAVTPLLCFGNDVADSDAAPFAAISGVEIVRDSAMDQASRGHRLARALATGYDPEVRALFRKLNADMVFEAAQFFGWRLGIPAIAWIPDFQHRFLPHLFSRSAWWKREIGFRAQIAAGRTIMLSSEDARAACARFYPTTYDRIHVVRFAVPPGQQISDAAARAVADRYRLPERYVFLPNQFWTHKNHALVIEALAILKARGVSITVAASGKTEDPRAPGHFERLMAAAQTSGVDFRALGLLPYDDLAPLAQASLALLNPSLFEGWSTTVEEARANGVPMLLSDLDVHREQAGDTALFFDRNSSASLADALATLEPRDPAVAAAARTAARVNSAQRIRRFADDFVAVAEAGRTR